MVGHNSSAVINIIVYISIPEEQRVQALAGRTGSDIQARQGITFEGLVEWENVGSANACQGTRYRAGGGDQKAARAQIGEGEGCGIQSMYGRMESSYS
jgi:hypothetical protein